MTKLRLAAGILAAAVALVLPVGCERAAQEGASAGVRDGVSDAIQAVIDLMVTEATTQE